MRKKIAALTACLLFAAACIAGCSAGYSSSLKDITAAGELVIGLDDTFAPMGFREADGTLAGFDIDLANAVCQRLGVTARFEPVVWAEKEEALSEGTIDCIWNGLSATPDRKKTMRLSQEYLENRIIVMTNPGVSIAGKEALKNFNIGVQSGSSALELLRDDSIYPSVRDRVTEYATYDEVILDMSAGLLDCMIIDKVFGDYKNAGLDGRYGTAPFDFGGDAYAVGFRKSDAELTMAVNAALNELLEDGTAAEISVKWFGSDIMLRPTPS